MKEVIGKIRKIQPLLPSKIIVDIIEVNEDKQAAKEFNNFFIDITQDLAKEIPRHAISFESYVPKSNSTIPTGPISVNEIKISVNQ